MGVICFGKMKFQKPWSWDEAAQAFTLKLPGVKAILTQDKAEPLPQVMGGFVASSDGLEATLIIPDGQLIRLEIRPNEWTPSPPPADIVAENEAAQ